MSELPPGGAWLHSFGRDPNGRLFSLDGAILRKMTAFDEDFYGRLLAEIAARPALRERVVETALRPLQLPDAAPVLEHKPLAPKLYPSEWSTEMFRDAALAHLEVHAELAGAGYSLQDAHPWNVLFEHCEPRFVDFGSFLPAASAPAPRCLLREYLDFMVYPLALMARGRGEKARRYLHVSSPPLELRDLLGHLGPFDGPAFLLSRLRHEAAARAGLSSMLRSLAAHIRAIRIPTPRTQWTDYHIEEFKSEPRDWHDKQRLVKRLVDERRPRTLLDIGCATGWYSLLAAEAGCRVTAADPDDSMVNGVYRKARARRLPLTPVVTELFAAARDPERFRCEAVFANALVHHLALTERWDFPAIVDALDALAGKWVLTEFVDGNDAFVKQRLDRRSAHYTLENLAAALRRRFREVTTHPSTSKNRTLLVASK